MSIHSYYCISKWESTVTLYLKMNISFIATWKQQPSYKPAFLLPKKPINSIFYKLLLPAPWFAATEKNIERNYFWVLRQILPGGGGLMAWGVGWSDLLLFCDFRKWTHCCQSGIILWVQFQKIGKVFLFFKKARTLKINIYIF